MSSQSPRQIQVNCPGVTIRTRTQPFNIMKLLWKGDFSLTHFALNFHDAIRWANNGHFAAVIFPTRPGHLEKQLHLRSSGGRCSWAVLNPLVGMSSGNCRVSEHAVAVISNSTVALTCAIKMTLCVTRMGESHLLRARYFERQLAGCERCRTCRGRSGELSATRATVEREQRDSSHFRHSLHFTSPPPTSLLIFFLPSSSGVAFTMRQGSFFCPVAWWITWHATSWRGLVSSRLPEEPCQIDVPVT